MRVFKKHLILTVCVGIVSIIFYNCSSTKMTGGQVGENFTSRRMLLRDEGKSQLSYEDLANPKNNWYLPVPPGRDLQLVGNGRVMIGTGSGYEERDIKTGKRLDSLTSYPGTLSAHRLSNGNTLLTGVDWQSKKGIVLAEVNRSGALQRTITYPGFTYVRLVRQTTSGTFLVTAGDSVFEGTATGAIIWRAKITGVAKPNAWQALRLANGQTIVSTGYSKNFQIFSADGKLQTTITGPAEVNPNFFAGFQIMPNGNYVVANWQGHGPNFGASGHQVLEYSPDGKLVWSWKQTADKYSSLQGVIVLDGLDLNRLHVENEKGVLTPIK